MDLRLPAWICWVCLQHNRSLRLKLDHNWVGWLIRSIQFHLMYWIQWHRGQWWLLRFDLKVRKGRWTNRFDNRRHRHLQKFRCRKHPRAYHCPEDRGREASLCSLVYLCRWTSRVLLVSRWEWVFDRDQPSQVRLRQVQGRQKKPWLSFQGWALAWTQEDSTPYPQSQCVPPMI